MAKQKQKTTELWLTRDKGVVQAKQRYILWNNKPVFEGSFWWDGDDLAAGCFVEIQVSDFQDFFPSLALKPGECVKVKATNTATGVSIRRIGKPFRGGK